MRNYLLENNPGAGIVSDMNWEWHTAGRSQFANSFARGGMVGAMFSTNRADALKNIWTPKVMGTLEGSAEHIRRMERIAQLHPNKAEKIGEQILKYKNSSMSPATRALRGKAFAYGLGGVANVGFGLYSAYSVPGSLTDVNTWADRGVAGVSGVASGVAFGVGMKAGALVGGTIGSLILPGVGSAAGIIAGGLVGGLGASMLTESGINVAYNFANNLVDKERARRKFDWVGNKAMFQTEKAYTMRQMSLAAMNNGMSSPRSLLGKESIFVHR